MNLTRSLLILCFGIFGTSHAENRSIDGTGNNRVNWEWGAANTQLARIATVDYADGISALAGAQRANPRVISNAIAAQSGTLPNDRQLSNYVWQWGQFVDHDIDLTPGGGVAANIPVPAGDIYFDPTASGDREIPFARSLYDPATGTSADNPRQQINAITSYLDASNVYGSDTLRADRLRSLSDGQLLTRAGNLLPKNSFGLANDNAGPAAKSDLILAGDVRANEQVGLTAMHTLFVREHNRLAGEIATANLGWNDEQIYQRARKIVGAQIQVITYQEFLPALLGSYAPGVESIYDDSMNASILSEFSTGFFRLGHSMIGDKLLRVQDNGQVAAGGHLALSDAFFDPDLLSSSEEVDYLLKGLSVQKMQEVDTMEVDGLRNFLFGPPGADGLDLASLNIQRGRDHGLPDYNTVRKAYGLDRVTSFDGITSDKDLQNQLATLYGSVDNIDLWTGSLAEDHLPGTSVGELLATGIADQFTRLRDGDRFWYRTDRDFSESDIADLESMRLSDIIMRNTGIREMQALVMFVPEPGTWLLFLVGIGIAFLCPDQRLDRGSIIKLPKGHLPPFRPDAFSP